VRIKITPKNKPRLRIKLRPRPTKICPVCGYNVIYAHERPGGFECGNWPEICQWWGTP